MKIHPDTITVLKNFAKINKSITITVGNTLMTITPLKTIVAKATTPTSFSKQFTIYDLDRFISVISLFTDPDFEFGEKKVVITDNIRSVAYTYADDSVIKTKPPTKEIVFPSVDAEFHMTTDNMKDLGKALGVLGLPHIAISGRDGYLWLDATDAKNPLVDKFSLKVGETTKTFSAIIKKENFNLFPSDYEVKLTSKGMVNFTGKLITYWLALEECSVFDSEK